MEFLCALLFLWACCWALLLLVLPPKGSGRSLPGRLGEAPVDVPQVGVVDIGSSLEALQAAASCQGVDGVLARRQLRSLLKRDESTRLPSEPILEAECAPSGPDRLSGTTKSSSSPPPMSSKADAGSLLLDLARVGYPPDSSALTIPTMSRPLKLTVSFPPPPSPTALMDASSSGGLAARHK